jgi:hypothetical protein
MVPAPLPSPDGAATGAVPKEGAEAARSVLIPPDALAVSPRPWLSRLLLYRLGQALRRRGWMAHRRYGEPLVMLRVYSSAVPCLGESITVVRGDGGWWFRSSTGVLLAPCSRVDLAASEVSALLQPWVAAVCRSPGGGGP